MLKVLQNSKYSILKRADAETKKNFPALVSVSGKVFAIGGEVPRTRIYLSSVSSYDINSNTWNGDLPPLNTVRAGASACMLGAMVYVFCGFSYRTVDTIERISWTSLAPSSAACWLLIEIPSSI